MNAPQWIVMLAVLAVAVVALVVLALGRVSLRPGAPAGQTPVHPVLLPAEPVAADVDRLRLATAVPGYQRDQVDAVLVGLRDALDRAERRIAELEAERPAPEASAPGTPSVGEPPRDPR
ncbi:cell division protein DivIVA [Micrococcus sp.]|uniref:cell division protein DivIVA n=1 Tax=Micrococcus sp. TaxID=1271 RepID=UPI002A90DA4D|nr:cell division protein DivIVA [Micrococcus sp.]MDY6054582.1 cell division protein DivIVA [Micrococcus sp.]